MNNTLVRKRKVNGNDKFKKIRWFDPTDAEEKFPFLFIPFSTLGRIKIFCVVPFPYICIQNIDQHKYLLYYDISACVTFTFRIYGQNINFTEKRISQYILLFRYYVEHSVKNSLNMMYILYYTTNDIRPSTISSTSWWPH